MSLSSLEQSPDTPEMPIPQTVVDYVNSLVKFSFAPFNGKDDFQAKLNRYFASSLADALSFSEEDRISFLRSLEKDVRDFLESDRPSGLFTFNLARRRFKDNQPLSATLSVVESDLRSLMALFSESPPQLDPAKRLATLLGRRFNECDLSPSLTRSLIYGLFPRVLARESVKAAPLPDDFVVTPEILGEVWGSPIPDAFKPLEEDPLFSNPPSPWFQGFLDFVSRGMDADISDSNESPADLKSIRDCLQNTAPQFLEGLQDLILLANLPSLSPDKLLVCKSLLLDLVPDLPDSGGKFFPHLQSFLYFIQGKKRSLADLGVDVANFELNFRKSTSHNPEFWALIHSAARSRDPFLAPSEGDPFGQYRLKPTRDLDTLLNPTERDVLLCILSTGLKVNPDPALINEDLSLVVKEILERCQCKDGSSGKILALWTAVRDLSRNGKPFVESIRQALACHGSLSKSSEAIAEEASAHLSDLIGNGRFDIRQTLGNIIREYRQPTPTPRKANSPKAKRESALGKMELFRPLLKTDNLLPLSEDEFKRRFACTEDNGSPLFYFDSALAGLKDKRISEIIGSLINPEDPDLEMYKPKWIEHWGKSIPPVLHFLAPSDSKETALYLPENFLFTDRGTSAFQLIVDHFFKEEDEILLTSEEYVGMKEALGWKREVPEVDQKTDHKIHTLEPFGKTMKGPDSYAQALVDVLLKNPNIRFILASDPSRRGTLFPLSEFRKVRDDLEKIGRKVFLIVDGCQGLGRRTPGLNQIQPDAFYASGSKAANLGGGGFLALSKRIVRDQFHVERLDGQVQLHGNLPPELFAGFPYALNPEMMYKLDILTIPRRQAALATLSSNFVSLVNAINIEKKREHVRILAPSHIVYRLKNKIPIPDDQWTGFFECEIAGQDLEKLRAVAKPLGVGIASKAFEDPLAKNSFRVAFHPNMGNDSLLVLGHVLRSC
jgi:Aminotransferase class-V